jgi:hypothetical protein
MTTIQNHELPQPIYPTAAPAVPAYEPLPPPATGTTPSAAKPVLRQPVVRIAVALAGVAAIVSGIVTLTGRDSSSTTSSGPARQVEQDAPRNDQAAQTIVDSFAIAPMSADEFGCLSTELAANEVPSGEEFAGIMLGCVSVDTLANSAGRNYARNNGVDQTCAENAFATAGEVAWSEYLASLYLGDMATAGSIETEMVGHC